MTFRADYVETAWKQVEVSTIEDFILFVEQVERQYPSATPNEVVSEIRQLWFSDVNGEILVSSEGISTGGKPSTSRRLRSNRHPVQHQDLGPD